MRAYCLRTVVASSLPSPRPPQGEGYGVGVKSCNLLNCRQPGHSSADLRGGEEIGVGESPRNGPAGTRSCR